VCVHARLCARLCARLWVRAFVVLSVFTCTCASDVCACAFLYACVDECRCVCERVGV